MCSLADRGRHETAFRGKNAHELGQRELEIVDVVQHPVRYDAVELTVLKREPLCVCNSRVHAPLARQLNHPRRQVDGDEIEIALGKEELAELPHPAADLEHSTRRGRSDGRQQPSIDRIRSLAETCDGIAAHREPRLRLVVPANQVGVVQLHGSTIGCPGMPRPGDLPPSQAFTVAPTSANSPPSWILPAALRPWT